MPIPFRDQRAGMTNGALVLEVEPGAALWLCEAQSHPDVLLASGHAGQGHYWHCHNWQWQDCCISLPCLQVTRLIES